MPRAEPVVTIKVPFAVRKRGGQKLVLSLDGAPLPAMVPHIDSALVKAIARAFRWQKMLETGRYATIREIARAERINPSYVSRVLRLTLLAPATVLAAVSNGVPLDLPGKVADAGFPSSGRWEPRPGVVLFAAINSPLTEPSRLPLSGPVKRRAHLIPMPDLLEDLARDGTEAARDKFFALCRQRLVPQLRHRIIRRGLAPNLDSDLEDRLAVNPSDEVLLPLWTIVVAIAGRLEVPFTLGVVQSILAFVLASGRGSEIQSLDRAIESKVLPHLQGSIAILDAVDDALGNSFPRSKATIAVLRTYAEENGDQVAPMY